MSQVASPLSPAAQLYALNRDWLMMAHAWPPAWQEILLPVLVWYEEVSRIRFVVSDPMIGQIRLAFWQEKLPLLVAGQAVADHPVFASLAQSLAARPQLAAYLQTILDIRQRELEPESDDFIVMQAQACEALLQALSCAAEPGATQLVVPSQLAAVAKALAVQEVVRKMDHWQSRLKPLPAGRDLALELAAQLDQTGYSAWPRSARRLYNVHVCLRLYLRLMVKCGCQLEDVRLRTAHPLQALRLWLDQLFN